MQLSRKDPTIKLLYATPEKVSFKLDKCVAILHACQPPLKCGAIVLRCVQVDE